MESCPFHSWDLSPDDAVAVQEDLRRLVILEDLFDEIRTAAGVDVHYDEAAGKARAAVAVLGFPGLDLLETATAEQPTSFIYRPGLLSFREVPPVLAALGRLRSLPDLLFCDGQGYAHPRRFGLACHLGVLTGLPSIGVAKTLLVGDPGPIPPERGAWRPLTDGGEVVGAAVRTRTGVQPLYVSPGHRVSLETAIDLVLRASPRFRQPEPIRAAHHLTVTR
jgi:deoxyribonuclease V